MQHSDCVPLVKVTRGNIIESIQYGAFIVVNSHGEMLLQGGNPELLTYPRSSMKPFQALPFIERGGAEAFNFSPQEISIMCASHSGTKLHREVLLKMHEKIGTSENDLACGVHWPGDAKTRDEMKKAGLEPTSFCHNCSGKHTGMLAHALLRGWSIEEYLDPQHPVQVVIRETLAEMVGLEPDEMPLGMDGCSAPVYGIPLCNMAHGVALLADPMGLDAKRADACRKITSALMAYPVMVAGPGKFDTDLMTVANGKLFCKSGAEGYQIIGVMPGVIHKDSPGLGIAMKISDGDPGSRARSAVSLNILKSLGVLDESDLENLEPHSSNIVRNWQKKTVGKICPMISLPKVSL